MLFFFNLANSLFYGYTYIYIYIYILICDIRKTTSNRMIFFFCLCCCLLPLHTFFNDLICMGFNPYYMNINEEHNETLRII